MIKEAIDRVIALAVPNISTHDDLEYSDKSLHLIAPPTNDAIHVNTLEGLVDLLDSKFDGLDEKNVLVHVLNPTTVQIVSSASDKFGRRQLWAEAKYPPEIKTFQFGGFMGIENFIIGVQAGFQRVKIETASGEFTPDLDYVIKMASKITNEQVSTNDDDGISQKVAVRAGITLKESETIKPRVSLAPYRTFAEIDQVVSEFVFRARNQGGEIQLALYEADGGRWRTNAMNAIADWLDGKVGGAVIIS